MVGRIDYGSMEFSQVEEVEKLIKGVFYQYIAYDYSEKGVHDFLDYIHHEEILKRIVSKCNNILIAKVNNEIVGVIETRDSCHISLLFVRKDFQKQGIAKSLIRQAFDSHVSDITVNASPFAAPIYEKMGFVKISGELIKKGITFIPMIYDCGAKIYGNKN